MFLNSVVNLSEFDNVENLNLHQPVQIIDSTISETAKPAKTGFLHKFGNLLATMFVTPVFVPATEEEARAYYSYSLPPYLV